MLTGTRTPTFVPVTAFLVVLPLYVICADSGHTCTDKRRAHPVAFNSGMME